MSAIVNAEIRAILGSQVSRGAPKLRQHVALSTGLQELDRVLDGGIPRGVITEICGSGSAGRMTLALSVMAEQSRLGGRVAWVDGTDRLDISSVESAGIERGHFLWVRAYERRKLKRSLCAAELLLESQDFSLVTLDIVGSRRWWGAAKPAWWVRLGRKATHTGTSLLVLGDSGVVFGAGLRLDCALSLEKERALLKVCFRWRQGGCGEAEGALLVMPPLR